MRGFSDDETSIEGTNRAHWAGMVTQLRVALLITMLIKENFKRVRIPTTISEVESLINAKNVTMHF